MTRRTLLRRLLVVVGIDALAGAGCGLKEVPRPVPDGGGVVSGAPSGGDALSASELDDVVAFAGVLVEDRELTPPQRQYVIDHLEHRTRQHSEYLALYRSTARLLERLAGRRFSTLGPAERRELVEHHRLGDPRISQEPIAQDLREVRRRGARDLIEGYYRSPGGWAVVGYATFPGRCGGLDRYMRREA